MTRPVPEPLRSAQRSLDEFKEIDLLSGWKWQEELSHWVLHCRLTPQGLVHNQFVPFVTEWYVHAFPEYPWGRISFLPARVGGLNCTFPHQKFNGGGNVAFPWRLGELCLTEPLHNLGRSGFDREPISADSRLCWHFSRALDWLRTAADGKLAPIGEPFELPYFPLGFASTTAYNEGTKSFHLWQASPATYGLVHYSRLRQGTNNYFTQGFFAKRHDPVYLPPWGDVFSNTKKYKTEVGAWIRIPDVPVIAPWQGVSTWGELRHFCKQRGVDLDILLSKSISPLRDGGRHLLFLGYGIPSHIGQSAAQMHWQVIRLPVLSDHQSRMRGFRPLAKWYWLRDRKFLLSDEKPLEWGNSENWDRMQTTSRGKLPNSISEQRVVLLGGGALGSPLVEMLIRAGVCDLILVDDETYQIGNSTRHTLPLDALHLPKAVSLANHLRARSPHLKVTPIKAAFPDIPQEHQELISSAGIVIDCTGEDRTLAGINQFSWSNDQTVFFSFSLGLKARRLFVYASKTSAFSEEHFRGEIAPWLRLETEERGSEEFPREGIGCWHPVFPARIDDVWLLASVAVKAMENTLRDSIDTARLVVYEQLIDADDMFVGVRAAKLLDTLG